jgi:hypothetical protein
VDKVVGAEHELHAIGFDATGADLVNLLRIEIFREKTES